LTAEAFPDWRYAPNITGHPEVYETENRALDRAGHVLDALWQLAPWPGKTVVDLGCGTGYWLSRYAEQAGRVIGIEPTAGLRARAQRRAAALANPGPANPGSAGAGLANPGLANPGLAGAGLAGAGLARDAGPEVEVRAGSAEHTGLPGGCADVIHARFAYFFPPGTDAGLSEALRVLRPGGHLVAVDNDYRWGEFSALLGTGMTRPPGQVAAEVDDWWRARGATRHEVRSELRFASRADLAAVLNIELPAEVARGWLARNPLSTGLTYGYVLFRVARPDQFSQILDNPSGKLPRLCWGHDHQHSVPHGPRSQLPAHAHQLGAEYPDDGRAGRDRAHPARVLRPEPRARRRADPDRAGPAG